MKVSFTGAPEYMDRNVGYGEASTHIINSFEKLGVECLIKSKEANIGISFVQPDDYTFGDNQYKIGYTPWESTDVPYTWLKPMQTVADEIWATSEWVANVYSSKTTKPIFVYEHGIEDTWIPKQRLLDKSRPFRFLHIGEPASRKDAQAVVDAFIEVFGDNPNVELVLKCSNLNTTRVFDPLTGAVKGSPNAFYKNIKIIESFLTPEQMNGLYNLCDVFVYPSWGEGFGFNPLQAMAQGMPTISTYEWAPYKQYITMPLESTPWPSPWPAVHPGLMLKPDYTQLRFFMKDAFENYEKHCDLAYKNSFLIHKDYNWLKVSKPAVERLEKIQKTYF
jgi:hypothetical protein